MTEKQQQQAELVALRKDRERLDKLEARRLALNAHFGTSYGWKFVINHNVNRLFIRDVNTIDLNDAEAGGTDVRTAIDQMPDAARAALEPQSSDVAATRATEGKE